jgi:hypothetical protein
MACSHLVALLGRHHRTSSLTRLSFQVVGQRHHLGHHLAGEVVEVLRHHDVGQVGRCGPCGLDVPTKFITAPLATAFTGSAGRQRASLRVALLMWAWSALAWSTEFSTLSAAEAVLVAM